MPSTPAIEFDSISKRFGDVTALQDLDLTVERGVIYGFLGPNGAGKSTAINILLGFLPPTDGQATVLGYDTQTESTTLRNHLGVLPEGYQVCERLTGREHLEVAAESKGTTPDFDRLLERVGIQEAGDRKAGNYSKGMTQRLVFGMALVGDPDLLILDEPSSGLDPNGAKEMRGVVAKVDLRQTGRSWRLLGLGAAFVFFFAGASAIFASLGRLPGVVNRRTGITRALVSPLGLLFPLVGILIGYRTIIGERVSRTIRILSSLPHARFEIVLGNLLSRVVLVSATATLGATVGYLSLILFEGSVRFLDYAIVIALALLLQATFVAISIGLSAGIDSETVVVATALGSVILI